MARFGGCRDDDHLSSRISIPMTYENVALVLTNLSVASVALFLLDRAHRSALQQLQDAWTFERGKYEELIKRLNEENHYLRHERVSAP